MSIKEVLTPQEEKFEMWRRTIGFYVGPLVFILLYFLPMPLLSKEAHHLLAVLGLVLVFWVTEAVPIPVTALIGAVLNILLGVASAKDVFAPFSDSIVFLFIGSFIIAEAISMHGLDKRFAFAILSLKPIGKSPFRIMLACGGIAAFISMWISNTAATVVILPIVIGVLSAMKEMAGSFSKRDGYAAGMVLMIAYGASIGGIATPVGTPPNLIGIGFINSLAGVRITFFEWMTFAVPIVIVMFIALSIVLTRLHPSETESLSGIEQYIKEQGIKINKWQRGEVNTLIAFGAAVFFWIFPSVVTIVFGKEHEWSRFFLARFDEGMVAVVAASLLFIIPLDWKKKQFTITWDRAVNIDWGTIILFGGGLSLGKLMFSTGLAEFIGKGLTGITGAQSLWSITAAGIFLAIVVSETTSNTASANMVIPVMIAMAKAMDVSPIPPALGACLGASFGFMLPVSTPPNAIAYSTGRVSIISMIRAGIIFDVIGFFIILFGLRVLCPLMGWA